MIQLQKTYIDYLINSKMGNSSSYRLKSYEEFIQFLSLQNLPKYLQYHCDLPRDLLNHVSIIPRQDKLRKLYNEIFAQMKESKCYEVAYLPLQNKEVERCVASLLGLGICDALGASTEFIPYNPKGLEIIKNGFKDVQQAIQCGLLEARSGTVGIWTDDCSMALSMAASLIYNKGKLVPIHVRYLFILWIANGFNNGGRNHSIGLGGNIKVSIDQFFYKQTDYCQQGNRFNNGNGSLMRLAPIPIVFRHDIQKAIRFAASSSRTTHNGQEAEECCKLLTFILIKLYKRNEADTAKNVLEIACNQFISESQSVNYLAKSMRQPVELYEKTCKKYGKKFKAFNQTIEDRNWNWKDPKYVYSRTRALDKPGYVGSYCMDALAMALHTIWRTNSFKEVAILNADIGGDCDTVGAIAGQIAGAMYGVEKQMLQLYSEMLDFKSNNYELFLHGVTLTRI